MTNRNGEPPKEPAPRGFRARFRPLLTLRSLKPNELLGLIGGLYVAGGVVVALGLLIPGTASRLLLAVGLGMSLYALFEFHGWLVDQGATGSVGVIRLMVAGIVAQAAAAGTLIVAAGVGSGTIALIASGLWALGLAIMAPSVRVLCGDTNESNSHPRRGSIAIAGLLITTACVALGMWQSSIDSVVIVALVAGLLGVNLTSLGLISLAESKPERWALIGITVVGTSAVTALGLLAFDFSPIAVVPSVLLIGIGLVPLSNALPGIIKGSRRWRIATWFLLGSGIGAVMTVSFSRADWPLIYAFAALLFAALFAFSLVSEVVPLALALVLGGVTTFSLLDRTSVDPANVSSEAVERLVVFGDSYISGEGADKFLPATNVVGDNECRRASTAYPYLVAVELAYRLDSYACSGATTYEVVSGAAGGLSSTEPSQLEQFIDAERRAGGEDQQSLPIAAVLVSVGGNDSWFGTLGQACFGPGSCDVHRNTLLRNVTRIGDRIRFVYEQIRATVGEDVPIVAMPYPLIMTETGCDDSPLTRQEHRFLFEFTEVLNEQTRVAALRAGINWFAPGVTAFENHRVCEIDDLAVNVLDVAPNEGALLDRILPINWAHGSAHPNEVGHDLTAKRLTPWLHTLLDDVASGERSPDPEPVSAFPRFTPPSVLLTSTRSLGIPGDLDCPSEELDISVQVQPAVLGSMHTLTNLVPGSVVCHTQPDGSWVASPVAEIEQEISIPGWDRGVALDFDPDLFTTRQIVLWESPPGRWRIDVFDYCELNTECADSPAEIQSWMFTQIGSTLEGAVVPVMLIFAGMWFLAIDIRRSDSLDVAKEGAREE